jgi:hypothetical protein
MNNWHTLRGCAVSFSTTLLFLATMTAAQPRAADSAQHTQDQPESRAAAQSEPRPPAAGLAGAQHAGCSSRRLVQRRVSREKVSRRSTPRCVIWQGAPGTT